MAAAVPLGAFVVNERKVLPRAGAKKLIAAGLVISAFGALVLVSVDADPSYLTDVLPGFALVGLGVGPMFVAISVAGMSDLPQEQFGTAPGLLMTGHEIGAASASRH
ncbi:hypothetical protein ACT8ZV_17790 [Nocardioides sp. MAHUQ-72]|uniref:hypothetical protein n=1 Tax=unclassified Nocardioides TaxID=2615069 RepID=UPI0036240FE5